LHNVKQKFCSDFACIIELDVIYFIKQSRGGKQHMKKLFKRKPKVIKTYRQSVPATRFIGKKYGDEDRIDGHGGFGRQWDEWLENGWFELLEESCPPAAFEDAGAYIGLMRWKETDNGEGKGPTKEPFQYWIGMFFPQGAQVPEGFGFVDFPAADLGVGWLYGKESCVFFHEHLAAESCEKQGMKIIPDSEGACWFFERHVCPRITMPDKKGKVTLDICHYVEPENKATDD